MQINSILLKYLSKHCIYAIHGYKCSSKKHRIHWGMAGRSYFREIKKHCTLKKLFPATKRSNLQGKTFFRNNYFGSHPFLMSCYFNKIFVHLPVIAAVYYFSVYKLIATRSGTMALALWEECERGQKKRQRDKNKLCNIKIVTLNIGTN